jgi:hypothetical protein
MSATASRLALIYLRWKNLRNLRNLRAETTGNRNVDHQGAQRYTKEWATDSCLALRALFGFAAFVGRGPANAGPAGGRLFSTPGVFAKQKPQPKHGREAMFGPRKG